MNNISRRKENMAVLQTITVTKSGVEFSTVIEAVDSFKVDNPASFRDQVSFNKNCQVTGDLIQTESLTEDKTGYIFNRTWSDAKWEEKTAPPRTNELVDNNTPVTYTEQLNDWTKTVNLSYTL
jgi:hypothetical protein